MAKIYEKLDEKLRAFIAAQKMFFVATAPLGEDGNVNVSPKGYDSLVVLDDLTLAWIDLGGSGVETMAHLRENGRITLMWCAFEGKPNILRVYGKAEAIAFEDPRFETLLPLFPDYERARSIVVIKIHRIADACGWGVPLYSFEGEREQLKRWVDNRPEEEWREHRYAKNAVSIDGLPGLVRPLPLKAAE
jgi:hypothetical protein